MKVKVEVQGGLDTEWALEWSSGRYATLAAKQSQCLVSALPDAHFRFRRRAGAVDRFVVLACDGVWDVMSDQECAHAVHTKCQAKANTKAASSSAANVNVQEVATEVLHECLSKGSDDNMTLLIAQLPSPSSAPSASA